MESPEFQFLSFWLKRPYQNLFLASQRQLLLLELAVTRANVDLSVGLTSWHLFFVLSLQCHIGLGSSSYCHTFTQVYFRFSVAFSACPRQKVWSNTVSRCLNVDLVLKHPYSWWSCDSLQEKHSLTPMARRYPVVSSYWSDPCKCVIFEYMISSQK